MQGIPRQILACVLIAVLLLGMLAALARSGRGQDVHRGDADCMVCHTSAADVLHRQAKAGHALVREDVDAVCAKCHDDTGPSHKTGMPPRTAVPPTLPLHANRIACYTCHFVHGEPGGNRFGDFVRIDNHRGGLCLSCHKRSELEQ